MTQTQNQKPISTRWRERESNLSLRRDRVLKSPESFDHCQVRQRTSHRQGRRRPTREDTARITLAGDGRIPRTSNIPRVGPGNPRPGPVKPRPGPAIPRAGPRGHSKTGERLATPRCRLRNPRGRARWTTLHCKKCEKRRRKYLMCLSRKKLNYLRKISGIESSSTPARKEKLVHIEAIGWSDLQRSKSKRGGRGVS